MNDKTKSAFSNQTISPTERAELAAAMQRNGGRIRRPQVTQAPQRNVPGQQLKPNPVVLDPTKGFQGGNVNVPPFVPDLSQPPVELPGQRPAAPAPQQVRKAPTEQTPFIPPLPPRKRAEKVEAEVQLSDYPREEETPDQTLGSDYERVDLPSRFILYPFQQLNARKFTIPDLTKINRALKHKNPSLLYDGVGGTIDVDIRDLSAPDFRYLMYWQRLNSYLKSDFKVTWTSKYGNENTFVISHSTLNVKYLDMPVEEYLDWQEKGYACPTVRDMEFLEANKLDEDTFELFVRAQYIDPHYPSVAARIEELKARRHPYPSIQARNEESIARGVSCWEEIREFREKLDFGVEEILKVRDQHFDPVKWLAQLDSDIEKLKSSNVNDFLVIADTLEAEKAELVAKMNRGEKVLAEEQEVRVNFTPWSLFPGI